MVETRAICRAPKEKTKSSSHLVKKESNKPCFEAGLYISPGKEKKTEKEHPVEKKTARALGTNGHDKRALVKNIA